MTNQRGETEYSRGGALCTYFIVEPGLFFFFLCMCHEQPAVLMRERRFAAKNPLHATAQ
jgi:hypothetical protein